MNTQPDNDLPGDRQAILDEINALLDTASGIDETRAKKVRKAIDALRGGNAPAAAGDPSGETAPVEEPPAADAELDAKIDAGLETLRERVNQQVERRNRDYEKSLQLTQELEASLKDNELQKAEHAYHKLMSIMGNIPGLSEQRWKDIEKRLNRVRPQLRKLESWRHWGTTQARQELIGQVRQLIGSNLPPEKLAGRIKQAREQWHDWDKSGDHAAKELWKEFDRTCEEAYQPCIAHFDALKKQRTENLRQRRAIIDTLKARFDATDWKQPDWRELDRFVSQTRRDYYKIGNVDFKHRKQVARALDEVLEKFEHHLANERAHSRKLREKLIADIEALATVEDLRAAMEQLETLKKQWVITVTGKRELENRLWKRFKAACDLTYQRRDATRKQHDAEREENLKHKQALIGELNQAAAAADGELLASGSTLARIQDRWQEIGWVPRKHEKGLENQWREAQKQFRKAVAAAQTRARASELDNLARRAALCNRWEQATLAGDAVTANSALAEWDALPAVGDATAGAMQQRFEQAFSRPDEATLSANLAARQDACLKLEVLLELDSPPECQAERMAYQIERLNASLKKELDTQDTPEQLLQSALTTGAVPAAAAEAIEARLATCLDRYREKS